MSSVQLQLKINFAPRLSPTLKAFHKWEENHRKNFWEPQVEEGKNQSQHFPQPILLSHVSNSIYDHFQFRHWMNLFRFSFVRRITEDGAMKTEIYRIMRCNTSFDASRSFSSLKSPFYWQNQKTKKRQKSCWMYSNIIIHSIFGGRQKSTYRRWKCKLIALFFLTQLCWSWMRRLRDFPCMSERVCVCVCAAPGYDETKLHKLSNRDIIKWIARRLKNYWSAKLSPQTTRRQTLKRAENEAAEAGWREDGSSCRLTWENESRECVVGEFSSYFRVGFKLTS